MKPIPYGRQTITQEDIDAVTKALSSDFLTQGPTIDEFEKKFAEYIGCKYAVAVNNGTAALHLCALALNVQPGDKVITTPLTFSASANCVRYCGGEVVFADINPETYLLDLKKVKQILQEDKTKSIKGIIPVDFAGATVNMEALKTIATEYGLWIIEDACHAPGGYFIDKSGNRQLCGNGKFADLSMFSFHPVKHIATGEGGMVTTNDEKLYKKLRLLRIHGITKDPALLQENDGGWYYEMVELGYNYRLTDFQAALGLSQLKRADKGLARRKEIAKTYFEAFKNNSNIIRQSGYSEEHAYHLYIIQVNNRKELYNYLRQNNILCQVHYVPVHLMPYYRKFGWKKGDFPVAEEYYSRCLSLPMFPSLTSEEQQYVINKVLDFYKK